MDKWETGDTATEYLTIIIGDVTITCALYADYGQGKGW